MSPLRQALETVAPWLFVLAGLATVVALLACLKYYLDLRQAAFFIRRQRTRRQLRNSLAITALGILLLVGIWFNLRPWPRPEADSQTAGTDVETQDLASLPSPSPSLVLQDTPQPATPRAEQPTSTATPAASDTPAGSPTAPFIPTNTPTLSPTPTATRTETPTPSLTPSITPTPSTTPTPSPTVPVLQAILTPVTPFSTPPADWEISELTVSRGVEVDGSPVNPGTVFEVGQPVLYASFSYDRMLNGIIWRYIWYRDEALLAGGTRIWEWGNRGRTYFFLRPAGGFPAGDYEVQLLLEEEVVRTARFTVREP